MAPNFRYGRRQAYYDGKIQPSQNYSDTFPCVDSSTAKTIAEIEVSSEADINAAISSARNAFPAWANTPAIERSRILHRAAALLRSRNDELAEMETRDTGKPFSETSVVDIVTGADVLEYYANFIGGSGLNGERGQLRESAWFMSTKESLGVCVGIGAWNYPLQIALWKSAPCLAAGNCMVYKPSEFTSLHGQVLAQIYREARLPSGVFNVVHGDGKVGALLAGHPSIAKVSFTGQVSTGKKVAAVAAGGMKYVTMELGGKSPCIILPGADLENATDGAMLANFYSSGQVCTNGTRVFVHEEMTEAFEKRLVEKMQYVRVGDLMDMNTNLGPLSSEIHHKKVLSFIKHGIEQDKAKLLYGGLQKPKGIPKTNEKGFWIAPTVFTDCTDDMKIVKEEIFGPVMTILTYKTIEEVIRRANDTPMGLAAGVFTKDLDLAHSVISKLEAGITWINTWGESPAEMAVGGWKSSGLGVENGRRGIEGWVRNRSTLIDMSGVVPTPFAKL